VIKKCLKSQKIKNSKKFPSVNQKKVYLKRRIEKLLKTAQNNSFELSKYLIIVLGVLRIVRYFSNYSFER